MSKLRLSVLSLLQEIGDRSGCHQMPERSFHINGYTFPVCARCTGVFLGQLLAVVVFLCGLKCPWYIAASLLALMGLDWLIQQLGIRESTNLRRLITGLCGGYGLFSLYISAGVLLFHWIVDLCRA
jgi:uncharacterized membrane protein